ncbi:hypothetical protein ACIQPT_09940 [Streptomyces sp. NPDC091289]|uniref:hypothetical protein n=1 Tax=Streptomyces sp. NPDC091289 TaxID=3365989 RepID=UPI00380B1918
MSQAERIAAALIGEALHGVVPEPVLEPFGGGVKYCREHRVRRSGKRVTLTRNYWLKGIPREAAKGVALLVFGNWREAGHRVDAAPDHEGRVVAASLRSRPDAFLMQVAMGLGGQLSVGVTSPCFRDRG